MSLTVYITNPLRGVIRQLTCPTCGGELPSLFPAVEVRFVEGTDHGYTLHLDSQLDTLLCCTSHCERRLMTQRRISPVTVEAKIDDGTRKKAR